MHYYHYYISDGALALPESGKAKARVLLICICFLISPFGNIIAQNRNLLQKFASSDQLEKQLVKDQKWVTYPDYTDREGWDRLTGSLKEMIIKAGEKELNYQWQYIPLSAYLEFERSGERGVFDGPGNTNIYVLSSLVKAELAEGKGRFIDQIINGVWFFCDMSSWANPNGLLVTSATHPSRPFPAPDEQVIDLVTGDLGALLAWTYYFLKDPMDRVHAGISARLRNQLRQRVLDPYMNRDDFWWQALNPAKKFVNNWNTWCNFNVLSCYLLLEQDPKKLALAVEKTMRSVDKFINYNREDGACEEGPAYWSHGPGKLFEYLTLLSRATGGKVSVLHEPIVRNLGEYIAQSYIGDGWTVNFADASARTNSSPGLIYRYGKMVGSTSMMQFAAYLAARQAHLPYQARTRELFSSLENMTIRQELASLEPALPANPYSWYPETQFCYIRSGDYFLAAKGGHNGESHNHNDIGSFILFYKKKPVFIDVGVGTYTRQTFSKDRYEIWTMQSEYHNVPVINGASQKNGAVYRSGNAHFDAGKRIFSLDISGAYDSAGVNSWDRSITLAPDGSGLVLRDNFVLSEAGEANLLYWMCAQKPDISRPGKVSFPVDGHILQLQYDPAAFSVTAEEIPLHDKRLSNVWGPRLYRLRLKALKVLPKGQYVFTVKAAG